ncbi:uncharacterized protein LOC131958010 [Physella acuta]|uniref:uncharacterized protein LOC131958010 n=1 Tax=Physella acuta TaxID=109671 RepID=UPI0027DB41A5|nr:uncharacterized protein LOC131958010 [Physella acuta]
MSTGLGFKIEASPNQITIGVTRYLTVNCTTTADSISGMASLLSLIIYRSHGADDTNFIELDSINVFQSSGHVIENTRDNQTSTVSEIRNMNSKIEQLSKVDDNQNRAIYGINSSVENMKTRQEMWNSRIESIKRLLFKDSTTYGQHRYYLSYPRPDAQIKHYEAALHGLTLDVAPATVEIGVTRTLQDFPDQNKAGVYRCEVNGVDRGGHPVSVTTGQTVTIVSPSVDVLVKQVQVLTSYIEQVHSMVEVLHNYNLNNRITQIDANVHSLLNQNLNSRIDQVNANVRDLQTYKTLWNARLETMKNSLFHVSPQYAENGHLYLLSNRLYTVDISRAQATCIQYGGYVAEVDTYDEMQFIRSFISGYTDISVVLIGGSDEAVEGHWVNQHNGTPTYLSWANGQPNAGTSETVCTYGGEETYKWQMIIVILRVTSIMFRFYVNYHC